MNHLENYYANYDEEGRLLSKHGQVEIQFVFGKGNLEKLYGESYVNGGFSLPFRGKRFFTKTLSFL